MPLFYRHEQDCQGGEENLKEGENEREGRMLYNVVELRKVEAILITWFFIFSSDLEMVQEWGKQERCIIKIACVSVN